MSPDPACIGDTITFTVSGVVDNGGIMREYCTTKRAIDPVTPTYTWTLTIPAGYPLPLPPLTGSGDTAGVAGLVPGTYSCTFIAKATRECAPPSITIGPETAEAIELEITTPNGDPTTSAGANAANERTYSSAAVDPTVTVPCAAAGVSDPGLLRWTIDDVGPIRATWSPSVPGDPYIGTGISPTATFTGLPPNYNDFGPKTITLTLVGRPACPGQDTQIVEIFFGRGATNHPGGQTGSPNFYHYWSQTSANFGTHVYAAGTGTGFTSFVGGAWVAHVSTIAQGHTVGGTWNDAAGIDLFANVTRHEEQHRLDMNAIWAAGNRVPGDDLDVDALKDSMEASLVPGRPYDPTKSATYIDDFHYLPVRGPLLDVEDYALGREAVWINGSANAQDWANPGMQHKTIGDSDD